MSDKDQHGVSEERVQRLERAIAAGDKDAVRAAGGAGSREGREAQRRVAVRRTAIDQRKKRDEQAEKEKEQAKKEKTEQAKEVEQAKEKDQRAKASDTPLRDAAVARQQQSAGVTAPDRAVAAGRSATGTSAPSQSATPLRDAAIARQQTLAAQRDRVDARSR